MKAQGHSNGRFSGGFRPGSLRIESEKKDERRTKKEERKAEERQRKVMEGRKTKERQKKDKRKARERVDVRKI